MAFSFGVSSVTPFVINSLLSPDTCSGSPALDQVILGTGIPLAVHCSVTLPPTNSAISTGPSVILTGT